jgi:hypothetical protein
MSSEIHTASRRGGNVLNVVMSRYPNSGRRGHIRAATHALPVVLNGDHVLRGLYIGNNELGRF